MIVDRYEQKISKLASGVGTYLAMVWAVPMSAGRTLYIGFWPEADIGGAISIRVAERLT